MRTTEEGILLIKSFENCRLTAYKGLDSLWTLGWGRVGRGIKEDDTCTQDQADQWLMDDVSECERAVLSYIYIQLTDNQLSAVVSFVYNVGLGFKGVKSGFLILKSGEFSSMIKYIRQGKWVLAAAEFPKWDKVDGVPCDGILRRRIAEQTLFLKSDPV